MCESFERTHTEFERLLSAIGMKITATKKINDLQHILICKNDL